MRYQPIEKYFYINNRKKFIQKVQPSSLAIFHSNDSMPTNADGTMGFRQNNDLFYLTGIDQEETTLLIDFQGSEILFIKETNETIKIWEGEKLTKEQATELSGISDVRWSHEFDDVIRNNAFYYKTIYLSVNEHPRNHNEVETRNERLAKEIKRFTNFKVDYKSSAPLLHQLRYFKEEVEIHQMQKAIDITQIAFDHLLGFIKPGVMEYEIEAEMTYSFLKNRSKGHAFQPIVASGSNGCVLHYISNSMECKSGDLVLLDFGAEYGNYNADLTRTIPINGKFSSRQKEVYNACLRVQKLAKEILVPGNTFEILNQEVGRFMEAELISLGLLDKTDVKNQRQDKPLYKKYFMHGTSHSLGLDVHDVDDRSLPFSQGMVFTCEPGIYILEEGIGIRLENDILITSDGNKDLMQNFIIEIEEIEERMNP